MEKLYSFHDILLRNLDKAYHRFIYDTIDWSQRLIALKGPRGTGKTTLMLQRIKQMQAPPSMALYITLEHPYFYHQRLFDLVQEFYLLGGRFVFIDEVHRYKKWSNEIKVIYDGFPDLSVVFSASSALDIYGGQADVDLYFLPGLSFREYLILDHQLIFEPTTLRDLTMHSYELARSVTGKTTILPLFKQYLKHGYYPFHLDLTDDQYLVRLMQVINTVVDSDLAYIDGYHVEASLKVKKLLGVVAESAPFKPNISALARKTEMSRDLIYNYLDHLQRAHLLQMLHRKGKGVSTLQKPDKIYLENTNLAFALQRTPDSGNIRETFFLNQLQKGGHQVSAAESADFYVGELDLTIEVGGRNKKTKQIKDLPKSYLAKDDIEVVSGKTIPLWLFGFLY